MDNKEMPEGWAPEYLWVIGKHGDCELGFVLKINEDGSIETTEMQTSLLALRLSIWQFLQLSEKPNKGD